MITISWNFIAAYCLLSFIIGAMLTWNLFGAENSWGAQKRAKVAIEKYRNVACLNLGLAIYGSRKAYQKASNSSKVTDVSPAKEAEAYFRGMEDATAFLIAFCPDENGIDEVATKVGI